MKITCAKKELIRALNIASKAVAARAMSPLMECVLLMIENGEMTVYGTDTVLTIKSTAPIGKSADSACIAVNARLFYDIVSKYPEGDIELSMLDGMLLSIRCGSSKAQLKYLDGKDYPAVSMFAPEDDAVALSLNCKQLRDMINQTIFSSAQTEDKLVLTGVLFELADDEFTMVALDGYRLALRRRINEAAGRLSTVIPARSLRELSRILPDTEDTIAVSLSSRSLTVELSDTVLRTRVLEDDYIKYRNILPAEHKTRIRAPRAEFQDAIERASILSREEHNNLVKFTISDDTLVITSNSELGSAREDLEIYCEGKELEIAFNAKYLTDVLKNIDDEEILADFNTSISPCVISPVEGNAFLYLILPVQIRG